MFAGTLKRTAIVSPLPYILSISRMSLPNSENASTLENAMQLMIQTFHKYSGHEGDKYTLSRLELKDMLTAELGNYLGVRRCMGETHTRRFHEQNQPKCLFCIPTRAECSG